MNKIPVERRINHRVRAHAVWPTYSAQAARVAFDDVAAAEQAERFEMRPMTARRWSCRWPDCEETMWQTRCTTGKPCCRRIHLHPLGNSWRGGLVLHWIKAAERVEFLEIALQVFPRTARIGGRGR